MSGPGLLEELMAWYDGERPEPDKEPERYVICAGLAVLEKARDSFPLKESDYLTPKNQVRTSRSVIQSILKRFSEERVFLKEGGRTTRGTRTAAEHLVERLNGFDEASQLQELSQLARGAVIDELQQWLVTKVQWYFQQQRLEVEIDPSKPMSDAIHSILDAAEAKRKGGAVAQHLVGAKLALRYPNKHIDNHSFTTADEQLGRVGDFLVGDTAFHVTVAPMPAVLEKCATNQRHGYRTVLIVPEKKRHAAREMADTLEITGVGIYSIEDFVGQNLEEMGEFGRDGVVTELTQLLLLYNQRVEDAETDHSILIEIPQQLLGEG